MRKRITHSIDDGALRFSEIARDLRAVVAVAHDANAGIVKLTLVDAVLRGEAAAVEAPVALVLVLAILDIVAADKVPLAPAPVEADRVDAFLRGGAEILIHLKATRLNIDALVGVVAEIGAALVVRLVAVVFAIAHSRGTDAGVNVERLIPHALFEEIEREALSDAPAIEEVRGNDRVVHALKPALDDVVVRVGAAMSGHVARRARRRAISIRLASRALEVGAVHFNTAIGHEGDETRHGLGTRFLKKKKKKGISQERNRPISRRSILREGHCCNRHFGRR